MYHSISINISKLYIITTEQGINNKNMKKIKITILIFLYYNYKIMKIVLGSFS